MTARVCPWLLAAAFATMLAGCGGSGGLDAGGFTSSLRHSAQNALNNLQYSSVPATLSSIVTTPQSLSACTVHVQSEKPLVFRLFMEWSPKFGGQDLPRSESVGETRIRFSWLQVIMPAHSENTTVNFGQIPASLPIDQATRRLETDAGPAFRKPFENCELLPNGNLYGFSYGIVTPPLPTTTAPPTAAP
jgi:hypothetical protein